MARRSTATIEETEPVTTATRTRRSEEERIEALEAQIAALKARAAAKKVKKDPSLRHISAALRSVDKALAESGDVATRMSLSEIRTSLSACLSLNGVEAKSSGNGTLVPQRRRAVGAVDADALLAFIQGHPGSRGEQIAAELGTDTKAMRPVMHRLIDEKKVKTKGQRRGMTYTAV